MDAYFLEASALVKRYAEETGSQTVLEITDPARGNDLVIAPVSEVELFSALHRKMRDGAISAGDCANAFSWFREDCGKQYQVRMLDSAVISAAVRMISRHHLRAYDAVQLGACVDFHAARIAGGMAPMTFVSADAELCRGAAAEGLQVLCPA